MIRHVALLNFKPGITSEQVAGFERALRALHIPGLIKMSCGPDLALQDGNMKFVIVADLEDVAAYHRYDTDEEHARIRREYASPLTESVHRAQFEVAG
jgi:Stress responsive A/B Barrel Domain